jgi:selenide,water dikinase
VPAELVALAHDPQTSGGLLAAVSPTAIATLEAGLDARGVMHWRIGHVEPSPDGIGTVALV